MTEMKRFIYAVLAVAATLSFAACSQENDINTPGASGKNTLAFKVGAATRSEAGVAAPVQAGALIPMEKTADGQRFFLEETVTTLDDASFFTPAETRGTPVYTENFQTISGGKFKGLAFPAQPMTNAQASAATYPKGGYADFEYKGEYWEHQYEWNPWFDQDALLFYAKMLTESTAAPAEQTGVITTSYQFSYSETAGQSMTFSYRSPRTAADMQDILFAARSITKQEAKAAVPILFYHALTGVKFATAYDNTSDVKTYIKKVDFTGLYGYGKCTVKSVAEGGDYKDITGDHSSASAISWDFSMKAATNSLTNVYLQDFPDDYVGYDKGGSFTNNGSYPDSFAAAGNKQNLNDGDASLTFWFPAQTITDALKLTVTFEIEQKNGDRKEYTTELNFGELLRAQTSGKNIEWKAGQLRTFTLKPDEVDITIEDKVHGFIKDKVVITNTGNTEAYIRAHIAANWWGKADGIDGIALGYKSNAEGTAPVEPLEYVQSWEMVGTTGDNYFGVFEGLPGEDWVLAKDGYFYYTKLVNPGETTGSPLFDKYELEITTEHPVPVIWYLSMTNGMKKFDEVRLVMDIPVQAIQAKKNANGEGFEDYKASWAAGGVTVVVTD